MSPESIESNRPIDIAEWVERARDNGAAYLERQATDVFLTAIGASKRYGDKLYLKGGILMGLAYQSLRQTADIDFTAGFEPSADIEADMRAELDPQLVRAAAARGYPSLECRVQSVSKQPKASRFMGARYPAIGMTVGFARRGAPAHTRLKNGQSPTTLKVDISFREPVRAIEFVRLTERSTLHTYAFDEIIAEKLRAILQQSIRNRARRQDIYDINYLVTGSASITAETKQAILDGLLEKSRSRDIVPHADALTDPETKRRSAQEWDTLSQEVDELPDFETTYSNVEAFYRSLPWNPDPI